MKQPAVQASYCDEFLLQACSCLSAQPCLIKSESWMVEVGVGGKGPARGPITHPLLQQISYSAHPSTAVKFRDGSCNSH